MAAGHLVSVQLAGLVFVLLTGSQHVVQDSIACQPDAHQLLPTTNILNTACTSQYTAGLLPACQIQAKMLGSGLDCEQKGNVRACVRACVRVCVCVCVSDVCDLRLQSSDFVQWHCRLAG